MSHFNLFLSHFTTEMDTKIQGMETWSIIEPKQDGLGMVDLIWDVTHRRDDMAKAILYIVLVDKEMILCHKK